MSLFGAVLDEAEGAALGESEEELSLSASLSPGISLTIGVRACVRSASSLSAGADTTMWSCPLLLPLSVSVTSCWKTWLSAWASFCSVPAARVGTAVGRPDGRPEAPEPAWLWSSLLSCSSCFGSTETHLSDSSALRAAYSAGMLPISCCIWETEAASDGSSLSAAMAAMSTRT